MARAPTDLRSLARSYTEVAVRALAAITLNSENDAARVTAATALLDRGWGKPATVHTGEDGEGAIEIVIRTITEARLVPTAHQVIEHAGSDGEPR
jgi:hypothetical protein